MASFEQLHEWGLTPREAVELQKRLRERVRVEPLKTKVETVAGAALLPGPRNSVTTASVIARAALWREESRGGHYRLDFPRRDDARWRVHSVIQKGAGITRSESVEFASEVKG